VKRTRIILLLVPLAAIVAGVVTYVLRPRETVAPAEPVFHGKRLSEWVVEASELGSKDERLQAKEAIRQLGTNALPYLLRLVSNPEPRPNGLVGKVISKLRSHAGWHEDPTGFALLEKAVRELYVTTAFNVLGPDANSAIPALTNLLIKPRTSYMAASALASMDPPAIPLLTNALKNPNPIIRANVVAAFDHLGTNSVMVLHLSIECAKDSDPDVRRNAVKVLGRIGKYKPEPLVPILIESLKDTDPIVRRHAAASFNDLGDKARPAVPVLLKAAHDPDRYVRSLAKSALKKIDPEAAATSLRRNGDPPTDNKEKRRKNAEE